MIKVGSFLAERYEILERIGSGGMSNVFKAKDSKLGRFVAIKVLKEEFCLDESFVTKFKVEAQSAASLSHSNIVNIYDVGQEGRNHYIVMEYLEGETLKEYIANNGQLSDTEILKIGVSIGKALEHAHINHIIHRDIKPQNIMITSDGKVKVMDFGIARIASGNTIEMSDTASGSVHYIAPEQARGGYQDNKGDIYSLGIVMYEMATGTVPFDGESAVNVALMQIHDEMPDPTELNENLSQNISTIIYKATQKKPNLRYQSADDMVDDIERSMSNPDDVLVYTIDNAPEETVIMSHQEMKHIWSQNEVLEYSGQKDPLDKVVTALGVTLAILIVSIIGLYIYNNVVDDYIPVSVTVPSVVGTELTEAEGVLSELVLNLEVSERVFDEEYAEGFIISQIPEKDVVVLQDETVEVVVSKGVETIMVPTVMFKDYEEAKDILEEDGFDVSMETEYNAVVPVGQVITQLPTPNESVVINSEVVLTVSKGPEPVMTEMPEVEGQPESDAKNLLTGASLELGKVTYINHETVEKGAVISASVDTGRVIEEGYVVDLTISLGPKIVEVTRKFTVQDIKRHDQEDYVYKITIDFDGTEEIIFEERVTSEDFPMEITLTGIGTAVLRFYNDGTLSHPYSILFTEEEGGE